MVSIKNGGMSLYDLLITKLSVLYDVESQLVKALPKLAKAATDKDLVKCFNSHLEETKNHIRRLDDAFNVLGESPKKSMKSAAIRGIIDDSSWVIRNVEPDAALDANLIAAASYAEHYEMAGYKSAREWAKEMGYTEVEELMGRTLEEEIAADMKLSELAEKKINERADTELEMQENK